MSATRVARAQPWSKFFIFILKILNLRLLKLVCQNLLIGYLQRIDALYYKVYTLVVI